MKKFIQNLRERFAALADKNDAEMPLTMRNYVLIGAGPSNNGNTMLMSPVLSTVGAS